MLPRPHEWNSGAAITVTSPWRYGIRSSIDTAGPAPVCWARGAPLGVPVVPEVRITVRPTAAGPGGASTDDRAMRPSTVTAAGASARGSSTHPTMVRSTGASVATRSVNSWSWISATGPSRTSTSRSWGPAKPVLR